MESPVHEDISYSVVYVAGYVLRKIPKQSKFKFNECEPTIKVNLEELHKNLYETINLLNEGGLMYPSNRLIILLNSIEKHILKVTESNRITKDTLFQISYSALDKYEPAHLVSCKEHSRKLTTSILNYYFILWMHFIARKFNSENKASKDESRKHRKLAKLQ
ncbi:hypothetical protein KQX54_004080 [Cotesia glomerata]|uniref:Uncharacterized protein n=1 Tax=Cotesia glomerata TaxID=32391 RepID=A0AAV7I0M7_COTGL|nr:hypothetical protein KQX54_004080 [Cotesia glomerata]